MEELLPNVSIPSIFPFKPLVLARNSRKDEDMRRETAVYSSRSTSHVYACAALCIILAWPCWVQRAAARSPVCAAAAVKSECIRETESERTGKRGMQREGERERDSGVRDDVTSSISWQTSTQHPRSLGPPAACAPDSLYICASIISPWWYHIVSGP